MNVKSRAALAVASAWLALPACAEEKGATSAPFNPPSERSVPRGPAGDLIRAGYQLATQTGAAAKEYVGNGLGCASCHVKAGRQINAMPWVGIWGLYAEGGGRGGSLKDKINENFVRSLNGKPLPADGAEMRGLLAYIEWLSQGVPPNVQVEGRGLIPLASPARKPDLAKGRLVYDEHCVACHGANGEGAQGFRGSPGYPPLWGDTAFGSGSSMARLNVAASFIKANMPQRRPGMLSDEQAYDVAAYVLSWPRPVTGP